MEAKIKVLLVVRWPVGGIRTFLKYTFNYFPSNNIEFTLLTINSEGGRLLESDISNKIINSELVADDKDQLKNMSKLVWHYARKGDIDIIHAHGFTAAAVSFLPSIFSRTKLILTSHDVLNQSQFTGFVGSIKRLFISKVLGRCEIVHSVSNDAEQNLFNFFPSLNKKRSVVIKNGIDSLHFYESKAVDLRKEFGLGEKTIVIGFFGRFMRQKGFRVLVDAVDYLLKYKGLDNLHVLCFGSGAFIREEQAYVANKMLSNNFTFAPFASDVSSVMKGCDLIAMPSLWEACPLQPMEALCSGVPFVGSRCLGLREVIEGTPAIVVEVNDHQSLANGIDKCLEIGRGPFLEYQKEALEKYKIESSAKALHNMYREVAG
ncbi:glycosyltransferase family 4 protein [Marinobacter mangrovi]|uniref:glycosyltransferase family 4 protein n=1 Tax=Marinobacter mangrovi TaxID=2803918 RepID=UPI0019311AF9|nr:glycosyltransferase family 4 protein [Marinobacter mangrovi]